MSLNFGLVDPKQMSEKLNQDENRKSLNTALACQKLNIILSI